MPTTKAVPTNIMSKEPAGAIGTSISAVLVALFAVLRAFDVGITDEMSSSITALVLALCAVPAIGGWLTRFFVYAPATVQAIANDAAATGEAADVAPPPPTKDGASRSWVDAEIERALNAPPESHGVNRREREDAPTV